MLTLQKIATDMLMYTSQEFNFFTANDSITTGSSMMPQKKNLDIAEIIRAKHGMIVGIENQVQTISHGLISGYNRDMQLIKKCMVEAYEITLSSIKATNHLLRNLTVNPDSIKNKINKTMFAADMATEYATRENIPFRDAYKEVMDEIEYMHIDVIDPMSLVKKRKTLGSPGNYY
jgi:argininosuccinate lyase